MAWTLTIGNKAYSSWSMRPWILLRHFDIPFVDVVIPLDLPTTSVDIQRLSPTGKVPVLAADDIVIWESLAIFEFIAERYPDKSIWPADPKARAVARAMASEMHAGFTNLRRACPTNFRRAPKAIAISSEVRVDIDRIEAAWGAARVQWGQGGDFLFGTFSAADAMFAPVVNRFQAYAIDVKPETRRYMDAVMALSAWKDWIDDARREPWVIDRYEQI